MSLPYPYNATNEKPISIGRINKVVISGNISAMYPLRCFAKRKRSVSLKWRLLSYVLPHPGYPDVTGAPPRGLVGDDYLTFLSKFRLMLVCPGRHEFEFLKFRECAYAGCCPFGISPPGLPPLAAEQVIAFSWETFRESVVKLSELNEDDAIIRAANYREGMREGRSPNTIRSDLIAWLASLS